MNKFVQNIAEALAKALVEVTKNTYLVEMAIAKSDYDNRVFFMLPNVVDHFLLIRCIGGKTSNHWANEIISFCNPLIFVKYKHTKKHPTASDFLKHLEKSGHDFDAKSLNYRFNSLIHSKGLKTKNEQDFEKIHSELMLFFNKIALHVETGTHMNILDIPLQIRKLL